MAVYHLFLGPENLREHSGLEDDFKKHFLNEKRNVIKIAKKHKQNLHYLHDSDSMNDLRHYIENDADEIKLVLHGEGTPFIIGFNQRSPFDLTAVKFAKLISPYLPRHREIKIDLLSCNSATDFDELNFAQNASLVFSSLGFPNIEVIGYTGFVVEKSNAKFSVSSEYTKSRKGNHASLKDAARSYQGGVVKTAAAREMTNWNGSIPQDWMGPYINVAIAEMAQLRFFQPTTNLAVEVSESTLTAIDLNQG